MEWIDYREKLGISFWDEKKATFLLPNYLTALMIFSGIVSTARTFMRSLILTLFLRKNITVSVR